MIRRSKVWTGSVSHSESDAQAFRNVLVSMTKVDEAEFDISNLLIERFNNS